MEKPRTNEVSELGMEGDQEEGEGEGDSETRPVRSDNVFAGHNVFKNMSLVWYLR